MIIGDIVVDGAEKMLEDINTDLIFKLSSKKDKAKKDKAKKVVDAAVVKETADAGNKNLPWTDVMVESLLTLVLHRKIHLMPSKKGVTEAWIALHESFFRQEEMRPYNNDAYYTKGSFRNIRDKYKSVMATYQPDELKKHNDSKNSGELSRIYELAKQIYEEKAEYEEAVKKEKSDKVESKAKIDATSEKALVKNKVKPIDGFGSRKRLDGSVVGEKRKVISRSLDDEIVRSLSQINGDENQEEKMEEALLKFITDIKKDGLKALVDEANIKNEEEKDQLLLQLENISIEILISIYCTRGEKYSAKVFKTAVAELEIQNLHVHKLYFVINQWRKEVEQKQEIEASFLESLHSPNSTSFSQ